MDANVPTILILCGIGILFLSLIGRFGTFIEIRKERQKPASIVGGLLLLVGLGLHVAPMPGDPNFSNPPSNPAPTPAPTPAPAASGDFGLWIIAGSFKFEAGANDQRSKIEDIGVPALKVKSDDYSFLCPGYHSVIVPVPGPDAFDALLQKVQTVERTAFGRENKPINRETCP